jgi:hypothetical protein
LEPFGECSDSAGDVFVAAYANSSMNSSTIYEYAHGGTSPVATLSDSSLRNDLQGSILAALALQLKNATTAAQTG